MRATARPRPLPARRSDAENGAIRTTASWLARTALLLVARPPCSTNAMAHGARGAGRAGAGGVGGGGGRERGGRGGGGEGEGGGRVGVRKERGEGEERE